MSDILRCVSGGIPDIDRMETYLAMRARIQKLENQLKEERGKAFHKPHDQ